jgi:hypothetical protein
VITASHPNTWMYGGILMDHDWETDGGTAKLWNGDEVEVHRGDVVTMLWTGGVVHVVEVKRPGTPRA